MTLYEVWIDMGHSDRLWLTTGAWRQARSTLERIRNGGDDAYLVVIDPCQRPPDALRALVHNVQD